MTLPAGVTRGSTGFAGGGVSAAGATGAGFACGGGAAFSSAWAGFDSATCGAGVADPAAVLASLRTLGVATSATVGLREKEKVEAASATPARINIVPLNLPMVLAPVHLNPEPPGGGIRHPH